MKRLLLNVLILFSAVPVFSQDPLHWSYSSKKINDSTFEIHMTAVLDQGWHAYSQVQPESAVALPTEIKFSPNPLVKTKGKIRELGEMIHWQDPATGISANQYTSKVDFVQTVISKFAAATNMAGTIRFQTCTDQMCLPPKTITFSIQIRNE